MFDLFISGVNRGSNPRVKELKKKETELAANFKAAVAAGDSATAKSTYAEFIKIADLKPDYRPDELGQTDSAGNGFAPTWGTEKQFIYIR